MSAPGSRDRWTWAGLAVVGAAADVLSFSALADLARLCGIVGTIDLPGITFRLAWLLPLAIDVFAITATAIWLRRRVSDVAITAARRAAWAAIAATVVGNAYHGLLVDLGTPPPWVAVVVVSAAPAVALGALVHRVVEIELPVPEAVIFAIDEAGGERIVVLVDPRVNDDQRGRVLAAAAAMAADDEPVDELAQRPAAAEPWWRSLLPQINPRARTVLALSTILGGSSPLLAACYLPIPF